MRRFGRSIAGRLLAAAMMAWPGVCAAQSFRNACDLDVAESDAYRVDRVDESKLPSGVRISLQPQSILTRGTLVRAQEQLQADLSAHVQKNDSTYAVRFGVSIGTIVCTHMDPVTKTVAIAGRMQSVRVGEGHSGGSLLDEASHVRSPDTPDTEEFILQGDRDVAMGPRVTARTGGRFSQAADPLGGHVYLTFSKSLDRGFYDFSWDSNMVWWDDDPRRTHGGTQIWGWAERQPFGGGTLISRGGLLGFGFEVQSGVTDLRATAAFRFISVGVAADADAVETQKDVGFQGSVQQEFTIPAGFFRVGGWADAARALKDDIWYSRQGVFARLYETRSLGRRASWNVDVTGTAGHSGEVPAYRVFTGGNRLEPFLADKSYPRSEYNWAGPILRGFGVSSVVVPGTQFQVSEGGTYWGFSSTVGLPGFSRPLLEVDSRQAPAVNNAIQNSFDDSIADMMSRRLRSGVPVDEAERSSSNEGQQLRRVLSNIITQATSLSLRPLLVLDGARMRTGANELTAWSYGGGIRLAALSWGAEILWTNNRTTPKIIGNAQQFAVRMYYGF
jgi:hypothetical protein